MSSNAPPFWGTTFFNLATIDQAAGLLQQYQRLALVGPAGSGKTYLAMRLTQLFEGEVHWFNASLPHAIPIQLALLEDDALHDQISLTDWINVEQAKWRNEPNKHLFVLDSCDDFTPWQNLIPPQSKVIITTRPKALAWGFYTFEMPKIPLTELTHLPQLLTEAAVPLPPEFHTPLWLSIFEKLANNPQTADGLTHFLQNHQSQVVLPTQVGHFLWLMFYDNLPSYLHAAGGDLLNKLLYLSPDQPIFTAYLLQLAPTLNPIDVDRILISLLELRLLLPGRWGESPHLTCYIFPSELPQLMRQTSLELQTDAFTAVADQVRAMLAQFYQHQTRLNINHWVYQLCHLLHLSHQYPYDNHPLLLADLGHYYYLEEWWSRAELYLNQALQEAEARPEPRPAEQIYILHLLGLVYEAQGNLIQARYSLVNALSWAIWGKKISQIPYSIELQLETNGEAARLAAAGPSQEIIQEIATHLQHLYHQLQRPHLELMCQRLIIRMYEAAPPRPSPLRRLWTPPQPSEPPVDIHILPTPPPAEPEIVFLAEPSEEPTLKLSPAEKIALIEGLIKFKQEQQVQSPTLQAELVQDFWELAHLWVEVNRDNYIQVKGWPPLRSAYNNALQYAVQVYGTEGEITRQIAAEFYEWVLPRSEKVLKQAHKVLRQRLGKNALPVKALQARLNKLRLKRFFGY